VPLSLGDRPVGGQAPALLVAEIGSNHDGHLSRALALIDAAAGAGADAVQFHSFVAGPGLAGRMAAVGADGPSADLHAHLARAQLRTEWHAVLRDRAAARGLVFLSTPFDAQRAELLAALGVAAIPVAACDLENRALLRVLGGLGRPLMLGTALAGRGEIDVALAAIGEGAGAPPRRPPVVLVTGPGPRGEGADLRAVGRLDVRYDCPVGWADRQPSHVLALGAVARGAAVVVKPFTDDSRRRGPSHATALDAAAFARMTIAVREIETALAGERGRLRGGIAPAGDGNAGRRTTRIVPLPRSES
jgi:sialic acid synthase SpsE